jgi:hypothetical protein
LLTPEDGAYLEGTQTVAATPTVADDDVTCLAIDGNALDADQTVGVSRLSFDVGANSVEARYHNYVLVNGVHRIDLPDLVNGRASLDIPNEHLVQGENAKVVTGTITTSCGVNHDDFVLSNVGLELLGEVADGEENEFSYSFGDGTCGSNSSLRLEAELSFFVLGDPQRTTGLSSELDTTTLANGEHEIVATTASGASVSHSVTVNNAPAGAPRLTPTDGTITRGTQPVFASVPAASEGTVESLTVDGAGVATRTTLGSGDATFSFNVGSNSIEARYHSFLLVNDIKLDIGGDYVSQRVNVPIPNEWLVPGDNTVRFVTGTFPTSCGANRDDYTISNIVLTPARGTAPGQGLLPTYGMGDGNCGSSTTARREVDLRFSANGPARGLRTDLDTTAIADGPHSLAATSGTGQTATRTLFTDSTAPTASASTPAAGATIWSSVPLDVQFDDASGVMSGPDVKLDGTRIELGELVGPGLFTGEHTLAVRATDSLGNTATREIVFRSAGIPDVPIDLSPALGATDVPTTADLEARVAEPDGGPVTATFSQPRSSRPPRGGRAPPRRSRPRCASRASRTSATPRCWRPVTPGCWSSPAGRDVTYQRFAALDG